MIDYRLLSLFLIVFLVSFALTWLVWLRARHLGLLDVPGARSAHISPVPRGGGLAIVTAWFLFALGLWLAGLVSSLELTVLGSSLVVAITGFLDDFRSLNYRWRIGLQLLLSLWVLSLLGAMPPLQLGPWSVPMDGLGWLLVPLALTWLCNLYNFMDGIDGLAGAQCCFVGAAAAWLLTEQAPVLALLAMGLFVASAGFLVWNWHPARIFMGDVGSTWIGFLIGLLALLGIHYGVLGVWVWFLLMGAFIADTGLTLMVRLSRGEKLYQAHNRHAYQHAARRFGHRAVVGAVMAINVLYLLPLAWLADHRPEYGVYLGISGIVPLFFLSWLFGAGQPVHSSKGS